MNRTDTKFIFHIDKLNSVLKKASKDYRILEVNNTKLASYNTIYFDTDNFQMYNAHHQGKKNRYKIRKRKYVESQINFLEIKFKSNKGKTIKKRIKLNNFNEHFSKETEEFIIKNTPINPNSLKAKLYIDFSRITLVNTEKKERITIDTALKFKNNSNIAELNSLVIAEVKREGFAGTTIFTEILKSEKIYPAKTSKYCTGIVLLNKHLKFNRFKSRFLELNKIINGSNNFEHILR